MPTYEYACGSCGHEWEQSQRITEPPVEVCPKCSSSSAHRLISGGTNFILKGGGWYSDLYASPKAPAPKAGESEAAKPSAEPAQAADSPKKTEAAKAPAPASSPPAASAPAAVTPGTTRAP